MRRQEKCHQEIDSPKCEKNSAHAARKRQQQTFHQQLADQATSAGAERRAHGHLFFAHSGASEQQIGDINAGDHQYEQRDNHQECEDAAQKILHAVMSLPDRRDVNVHAFGGIRIGILLLQMLRDRGHFRLGLRDGDARSQPPHDVDESRCTLFEVFAGQHHGLHHHGNEILRVNASDSAVKVRRRHTDDGERVSIDVNRAAHHIAVGTKKPLPQSVAENDVGIGIRSLIRLHRKTTAHGGLHTESVEIIFGGEQPPDALRRRLIADAHVHTDKLESDERRKHMVLVAKIPVVRIRTGVIFAAGHDRFDGDHLAGAFYAGERIQDDCTNPAENGGVSADAESERENGDGSEAGTLQERADAEAQILKQRFHLCSVPSPDRDDYATAIAMSVASSCQWPRQNSATTLKIFLCKSSAESSRFSSSNCSKRASPNSSPSGLHASVTPSVKSSTRSPAARSYTPMSNAWTGNTPRIPPPSRRRSCEPSLCVTIGALCPALV